MFKLPSLVILLRNTNFKSINVVHQFSVIKNVSNFDKTRNFSLLPKEIQYNKDECDKILNIINNENDLEKFNISRTRIEKIELWKQKNGQFETIEQILHLDGFGVKILDKLCKSILDPKDIDSTLATAIKSSKFTIPPVPEDFRAICKSCLSLHIGISNVTWSRIELNEKGPCELTHWEYYDLGDKKIQFYDFVKKCVYLDYIIPEADCYILESPQTARAGTPGSVEQVNINIHKSQFIAMLSFALAKRKIINHESVENTTTQGLFYLKRFLAPKLFGTLVGTEKVATEHIILDLLRTRFNIEDYDFVNDTEINLQRDKLSFPYELRTVYQNSEGFQREFLGQSLLLGLAFIRLCLFRCPSSISIVTSQKM